ncbi:hypothetical protein QBC47DRAFT_374311 [Echria macrotheca]|uniref:Response regulatory domain-containing protein n=1 Tax=Echria macrotheca TaxID=438768 RepID=A0AAJ0BI00_9PEZI|nr:hypothetical protein QBC47DRAFT_374311 [Echria macrotheca]
MLSLRCWAPFHLMPHVMGDLRSKLRAKFPRRNSGIPSLATTKSGIADTSESDSQSRTVPESPSTGQRPSSSSEPSSVVPVLAGGEVVLEKDGKHGPPPRTRKPSHSSSAPHATTLTPGGQARDKLKRKDTKQEISNGSADVRAGSHDIADADGLPLRAATGPNHSHGSAGAENASATMRSAEGLAVHGAGAESNNTSSLDDDQRALMLKLSRANDGNRPHSNSDTLGSDAASDEHMLAPPAAATEQTRRVKLSDTPTPVNATPSNANANHNDSSILRHSSSPARPAASTRRQSVFPSRQATLIRNLLSTARPEDIDAANAELLLPLNGTMTTRKIWVKRPGASPTLITIKDDDLVDDVREMILHKYGNSLGRHFDAPDLTLRIVPREQQRPERLLGPEEPMSRTLDAYFPGGQTVDEALLIDIPARRTPRPSPRTGPPHAQHLTSVYREEHRPLEAGTDYFGPDASANPSSSVSATAPNAASLPHSMSIVNTGQVPPIPSPGGGRARMYRERPDRPRLARQHTSSPTVLNNAGHAVSMAGSSNHTDQSAAEPPPPPPPLPTPPAQDAALIQPQRAATPPPRAASPRPLASRPKKKKTATDLPASAGSLPGGFPLLGGVPRINVLIVEDNIINLRLLEAFIKRLKVRWETAMDGQDAVNKWRKGGFHLVLMDIQLPVMSGLEATREIRRLERMNSIGAFSTPLPTQGTSKGTGVEGDEPEASPTESPSKGKGKDVEKSGPEVPSGNGEAVSGDGPEGKDKLENRHLFKSPVIIVALTASSLQSDRHDALAAGCNDFLTKPVTYVWLERKVTEWGCMQALIDYDGWRQWRSHDSTEPTTAAVPSGASAVSSKKTRENKKVPSAAA